MRKMINETISVFALMFFVSAGFASAQDQAAASFDRAFSLEDSAELDFRPVVDSWDRFLQEPLDYYFTNVRYSFVREVGAPLTLKTETGRRDSQSLAFAGWEEFISQSEIKLATPKRHFRISLRQAAS